MSIKGDLPIVPCPEGVSSPWIVEMLDMGKWQRVFTHVPLLDQGVAEVVERNFKQATPWNTFRVRKT